MSNQVFNKNYMMTPIFNKKKIILIFKNKILKNQNIKIIIMTNLIKPINKNKLNSINNFKTKIIILIPMFYLINKKLLKR